MVKLKRLSTYVFNGCMALLVLGMVVVVFLQVVNRYVFNSPLSWTEELARFLFVWLTFLGAFWALVNKNHIGVNSLVTHFSFNVQKVLSTIIVILIFGLSTVISIVGIQTILETTNTYSPALNISLSLIYASIPVSTFMMLVYLLTVIIKTPLRIIFIALAIVTLVLGLSSYFFIKYPHGSGELIIACLLILITSIAINTPIAFAIGLSGVLFFIWQDKTPLLIITNRMVGGVDSFPLLSIPFFVLAGELMNTSGITLRLVNLAKVFVGHIRGGLGMVVIIAEYFFSGISGSTVADVSAIGSLLVPAMKKAGYKAENAVAIVSAASAMGILVPPCIAMIVLGGMTGISIGLLFIAGFIPAIVMAICIMILTYIQAFKLDIPLEQKVPIRECIKAMKDAIIPLMLPVIIFLGIATGALTATEVSVVAVIYAFVVGTFVFKEIKFHQITKMLVNTAATTGMVMFLVGTSSVLSWIFATNQVPQKLGLWVSNISSSPWMFLLLSNLVFIIIGAVLEGLPAIIILIPIFMPLVKQFGVDPTHFCILAVAALGIGIFVPPIGVGLFISCNFGGIDIGKGAKAFLPYLIVLIIGLLIISYVPWFTLILPKLIFAGK